MPHDDAVQELARTVARVLCEHKAQDVVVLGVSELTPIADSFVIGTGLNSRHLKALAREAGACFNACKKPIVGQEGVPESGWMLIDAGDVVVHVLDRSRREVYNLDVLWGDARRWSPQGA